MTGYEEEKNKEITSSSSDLEENTSSINYIVNQMEEKYRNAMKAAPEAVFDELRDLFKPGMVLRSMNYMKPIVIIKYSKEEDRGVEIWANSGRNWVPITDLFVITDVVGVLGEDYFANYFMYN